MEEKKFKEYFATTLVILTTIFILYTIYNFAAGFFGSLLLYIILIPLHNFMLKKGIGRKLSATIILFIAFFIIVVPLLSVLGIAGKEIFQFFQNPTLIENTSNIISKYVSKIMPSLTKELLIEKLTNLGSSIASLFFNIASSTGKVVINFVIAFYSLYYMLIQKDLFKQIKKIIPFNEKHSLELVNKIKDISKSTVLIGGVIALVQGGLLTISFLIFGIEGAFLWGFITAIVSFLPVMGAPLVWIPAAVIQFFQQEYWATVGIILFGLFLSNIDIFIRTYLGKSISKIHPMTTLVGVFIGIPLFGLIGIFVGPLLIAFSVLLLKSFKEEYIN